MISDAALLPGRLAYEWTDVEIVLQKAAVSRLYLATSVEHLIYGLDIVSSSGGHVSVETIVAPLFCG
jgi:hypothetical protein